MRQNAKNMVKEIYLNGVNAYSFMKYPAVKSETGVLIYIRDFCTLTSGTLTWNKTKKMATIENHNSSIFFYEGNRSCNETKLPDIQKDYEKSPGHSGGKNVSSY